MEIKNTTLSKISNVMFGSLSIFILIFIWVNYSIKNINVSFLASLIITTATLILFFIIKKRVNKKQSAKYLSTEKKEYTKIQLHFSNELVISNYMINFLNINHQEIIDNNHIIDKNNNIEYYFLFSIPQLTQEQLNYAYQKSATKNIEIYCLEKSNSLIFLENINVNIIDFNNLYQLFLEKNQFPDFTIKIKKTPKYSLKNLLCIALNKDRSKSYFYLSLFLLFSSVFVSYKIYYIITSSILLLLSIYSQFNNRFNT